MDYNRCETASLMVKHANQLLTLMDKTYASRNALRYFEWCNEIENFMNSTVNSTPSKICSSKKGFSPRLEFKVTKCLPFDTYSQIVLSTRRPIKNTIKIDKVHIYFVRSHEVGTKYIVFFRE